MSVTDCCSLCHIKDSATIMDVITNCSSQQSCNFMDLYQGNVLLLYCGAKAVVESSEFKGNFTIHCILTWACWPGPSNSSRARTMLVVKSSPVSVTDCCSLCHIKDSATIMDVITNCSSQQSCNFMDLYQGNVLLLYCGAKAVVESSEFKGNFTIHCLQSIDLNDSWCWVRSWNASEALSICPGCVS